MIIGGTGNFLLVCYSQYQPLMLMNTVNIRVRRGTYGGTLVKWLIQMLQDQTDSYKYTKGVSMGPGFGD